MKKTKALVKVASTLLAAPDSRHHGYDLAKRSGVRGGSLYPILTRMLAEGWLSDGWEDPATVTDGRPPRRYYRVTPAGQAAMREMVESA